MTVDDHKLPTCAMLEPYRPSQPYILRVPFWEAKGDVLRS